MHGEVRTSPTTKEKGTARRLSKPKVRPGRRTRRGDYLHVVVPDSFFLKQDVKIVLVYCTTQDSKSGAVLINTDAARASYTRSSQKRRHTSGE